MGGGRVLTQNARMLPKTVQILLFSATFPDKVMAYARKYAPNSNEIKLRHQELTVKGISQMYMDCPDETKKYDVLCKLYGLMTIGSSVIFVRVGFRSVLAFFPRCFPPEAHVLTRIGSRPARAPTRSSGAWRRTDTRSRLSTVRSRA